jgi:hypothetical protein
MDYFALGQQEAVRTGCDFDAEYHIVRPDGQVRYLHSHAYPVFGESGELVEYVGTVADNTEQRQGEEVIVLMRTDLHRNNITVRAELAQNLQLVRCDRVRMQRVILNLIVNAVEAMVAVVTRPKLLAIATTADVTGVIVSVNDSGVGASGATFRFRLPFNGAPAE